MMSGGLFADLEDYRTFGELGAVSGYKLFLRALSESQGLRRLQQEASSPEDVLAVFRRATEVVNAPCDPQYAHPSDLVVAAYMYFLRTAAPEFALDLARRIEQQEAQFWWAAKLAAQVKQEAERQADVEAPALGPSIASSPPAVPVESAD
jgi:hypothetical protein